MSQPEEKKDLTFEDILKVDSAFAERLSDRGRETVDDIGDAEKLQNRIALSNEIINKTINFCDQFESDLSKMTNWQNRKDIFRLFANLTKLFNILYKAMSLTSGDEELDKQAERFNVVFEKFFVVYLSVLDEAKKHKNENDPILDVPIIAENELEEQKFVLGDDMIQEVLSTNHLLLDSIKKLTANAELAKILEDY